MTPERAHREALEQGKGNAQDILSGLKNGTFLELKDEAVFCDCHGKPRRLLRFFVGPDDEGTQHVWAMVPTYNHRKHKIPAWANIVSHAAPEGKPCKVQPMVSLCRFCKTGRLLVPGCCNPQALPVGTHLALRAGPQAPLHPWKVGEQTDTFTVTKVTRGPSDTTLYEVNMPRRGTVTA